MSARATAPLRIVIGQGALATNPEAGGLWACLLQYPLGLRALGHDVLWLEMLHKVDPTTDQRRIDQFLARMRQYGLDTRCAFILFDDEPGSWAEVTLAGPAGPEALEFCRHADL